MCDLNVSQEDIFISWNPFMRMKSSLVFYLKARKAFEGENKYVGAVSWMILILLFIKSSYVKEFGGVSVHSHKYKEKQEQLKCLQELYLIILIFPYLLSLQKALEEVWET